MINSFLVTLCNTQIPPVNPLALSNIYWPDQVLVRTYNAAEERDLQIILQGNTTGLPRLLASIQLLWVVENSVRADTITRDDPRVTYTRGQLQDQFFDQTGYDQHISQVLPQMDELRPYTYMDAENARVFDSVCPLDRLAAVVAHFGARP